MKNSVETAISECRQRIMDLRREWWGILAKSEQRWIAAGNYDTLPEGAVRPVHSRRDHMAAISRQISQEEIRLQELKDEERRRRAYERCES